MVNTDSFGQTEPTFTEDPLTGVIRSGDQTGNDVVNMGDRFGNPFRWVASGIIANNAGAAVVADLAEGYEYLLMITCSDDSNLLVAADVDSTDDINIVASAALFDSAGALEATLPVELLATNAANTSSTYVSFVAESQGAPAGVLADVSAVSTTGNDTAQLQLKGNGEVSVSHTDGGDSSNGAFMLFWRELPSSGTPRFGNSVSVAP